MVSITSAGVGSGLDINSIIKSTMDAEKAVQFASVNNKEMRTQIELSGVSSAKGALSNLQSALSKLSDYANFNTKKITNSNETYFTATASDTAQTSQYSIEVTKLAQAQKLSTATIASSTQNIGTGSLCFQFGTYDSNGNTFTLNPECSSRSVVIDENNQSLEGIRNAVNQAKIGVNASIINDGSGYRLVFTSEQSGKANSLRILTTDADSTNTNSSGLSQLSYDPCKTAGTGKNLSETVAAQNAELNIDGLSISASTNTITSAIEGVSLHLKAVSDGQKSQVVVASDDATLKSRVNAFVNAYNTFLGEFKTLTAYDPATKKTGTLNGDAGLRSVDLQMRRIITSRVSYLNQSNYHSLADIGISTTSTGVLKLDATQLDKVIEKDSSAIGKLFAEIGSPSDSFIRFSSASPKTPLGEYTIAITEMATQGKISGSSAANLTIISGINDSLRFNVDDILVSITLNPGTYTAENLALECQSKMNGSTALQKAEKSVSVSASGGIITIQSAVYGSLSSVKALGGNGLADLLGMSPSETTGKDVKGLINGNEANGSGQFLSNSAGLKCQVLGGAIGERGTLDFSRGVGYALNHLLDEYLSDSGPLSSREKALNQRITEYGKQRSVIQRRLDMYQDNLVNQYTSLDKMVAQLRASGNFLMQQMSNMNFNNQSR